MIGLDPRAQEIFCAVAELPEEERLAELSRLCGDDAALAAEVRSLLGYHDQSQAEPDFLNASGLRATLSDFPGGRLQAGTVVGAYTIVDFVGAGGMGDVYAARQARPSRLVALKIVRPGLASERMVRLFIREAEILGLLSHAGIAQVFEAGVADYGLGPQPFLAMELVKGESFIDFLQNQSHQRRTIVELVARICDAVQHAHQRGVIHRDIKPGNIVVTRSADPTDTLGWQPKVLDFGIARTLDAAENGHTTMHTSPGQLLGTLAYMSPEQVSGSTSALDTRTDVYSLGVVLFRALAGRLPRDLTGVSLPEAIRLISSAPMPRLAEVDRAFKGDLDAIVAAALEPNRARRYQSASDLAADLRRYLAGRPILARQENAFSSLSRRMARYRTMIAVGAMIAVTTACLAVYAFLKAGEAHTATQAMAESLQEAELQGKLARESAEALRSELRIADIRRAKLLANGGGMAAAQDLLQRLAMPTPDAEWTWASREIVARGRSVSTLVAESSIRSVTVSPDGRFVASANDGGRVQVFDVESGQSRGFYTIQPKPILGIAAVSNAAFCAVGEDGTASLVRFADGMVTAEIKLAERLTAVDASRMGLIAVAGPGVAALLDSETLEIVRQMVLPREIPFSVRISDSLQQVAFGCRSGRIHVFDLATPRGQMIYRPHGDTPASIEFLDNPPRVVSVSGERNMVIASLSHGTIIERRPMNNGSLRCIRLSSDGRHLAIGGWWRVDVLDAVTLKDAMTPLAAGAESAHFSADGSLLVTGARTWARLWSMNPIAESVAVKVAGQGSDVTVSPDRTLVVGGGVNGSVIVTRASDGSEVRRWMLKGIVRGVRITPDNRRVLAACEDRILHVLSMEDGTDVPLSGHTARLMCVDIDRTGRYAFTGSLDQTVRRWDLETLEPAGVSVGGFGEILGMKYAPDGSSVAVLARTRKVSFLNPESLEIMSEGKVEYTLWRGDFSPDAKTFAAGSWGPSIEVLNVETGQTIRSIRGHVQLVPGLRYSPDGTMMISASVDRTVKVWDAASGSELASFEVGAEAYNAEWLDDGFVVCTGSGGVKRWKLSELDRAVERTMTVGALVKPGDLQR